MPDLTKQRARAGGAGERGGDIEEAAEARYKPGPIPMTRLTMTCKRTHVLKEATGEMIESSNAWRMSGGMGRGECLR